jgi:peptidoglycan/LPS O-acetylase OafA/YrhL
MGVVSFFRSFPSRLRRVTSAGGFISEIDGLRFLAIFPVVIQHLSERFERNATYSFKPGAEFEASTFITNRGFIGVYIFFAISGFILALPFASHLLNGTHKVSLKSYFLRRLSRLEPPYLIAIAGITISLVVMGAYSWREILPHFGASMVYLHSLIYHSWTYINPPVWTLEIEVQFYILAPFLAWLFFSIRNVTIRRSILVASILALMIFQQYTGLLKEWTILTILAHLQFFLVGFIIADIYLINWKVQIKRSELFNYLALFAFAFLLWIWSWDYNFISRILFVISLFLLVYSVFRATWFNRFLSLPWITAIGGMCYTIYLIHLPIIEFLIRITKSIQVTSFFSVNFLIQFIIIGPILFLISIVFFLLIEKPCMHRDWPSQAKQALKSFFKRV